MPMYPIHPCCYCSVTESGKSCRMTQKVNCNNFLAYIQTLNNMKAQRVLIQELKYLISNKGGK